MNRIQDDIVRVGKKPNSAYVLAALNKLRQYSAIKIQGFGIRTSKARRIAEDVVSLTDSEIVSSTPIEVEIQSGKSYGVIILIRRKTHEAKGDRK